MPGSQAAEVPHVPPHESLKGTSARSLKTTGPYTPRPLASLVRSQVPGELPATSSLSVQVLVAQGLLSQDASRSQFPAGALGRLRVWGSSQVALGCIGSPDGCATPGRRSPQMTGQWARALGPAPCTPSWLSTSPGANVRAGAPSCRLVPSSVRGSASHKGES